MTKRSRVTLGAGQMRSRGITVRFAWAAVSAGHASIDLIAPELSRGLLTRSIGPHQLAPSVLVTVKRLHNVNSQTTCLRLAVQIQQLR